MVNENFNFDKLVENINLDKNIFQPNLTSQLSIQTALSEIQNNSKVLDLGCGCGIIGIAVMKNFSNINMCCSDLDKKSIEITKNNFSQNNFKADIREGNLFEPWDESKFDYIINDVSGISNLIAKKSPWFGDKVPCDTGEDGSDLAMSIIENASFFLNENGSIQIPLISFSNIKKIIKSAEEKFLEVKIAKSKDWFLPKEMENIKDTMYKLKSLNYINFEEKFGKIICTTSIAVCKKPKN